MAVCLVARRIRPRGRGGMETRGQSPAGALMHQGRTVHVLTTAVPDRRGCAVALGTLIHAAARRRTLGAAGRKAAQATFHIRTVGARRVEVMGEARC